MRPSLYYLLDENHVPVPVDNVIEWALRFEQDAMRIVDQTQVSVDVRVSTVFLGIDLGWGEGPPMVFETMIFGGEHDQYQKRYSFWDEAVAGHQAAIEMIFEVNQ